MDSLSRVRRVIGHHHACSNGISRNVPEDVCLAPDRHWVVGISGAGIFSPSKVIRVFEVPGVTAPLAFADRDDTIGLWPICGLQLSEGTEAHSPTRNADEERPKNGNRESLLPCLLPERIQKRVANRLVHESTSVCLSVLKLLILFDGLEVTKPPCDCIGTSIAQRFSSLRPERPMLN